MNYKLKNMLINEKRALFIILFLGFLSWGIIKIDTIHAQPLTSPRFTIHDESLQVISDVQELIKGNHEASESPKSDITDSIRIRSGYPFSNADQSIQITLSDGLIVFDNDFDGPQTASSLITYHGASPVYSITLSQTHNLTHPTGETFPSTLCDQNPCTPFFAKVWENTDSYGYGYRIEGIDAPPDFYPKNSYRSFASVDTSAQPPSILKSSEAFNARSGTLLFRINPPPHTPIGTYEHELQITVLPGL